MNKLKKGILKIISIILILVLIVPANITIAKSKYITVEEYIQKLATVAKLKVDKTVEKPYIETALANGLIKDGEFKNYNADITREEAALLSNRTDEILYGTTYDEVLYNQIKNKKRIKDLSKVKSSNRDEVIKVFEKGIMVGDYNGAYTHDRTFRPKDKLLSDEASTIITRLGNEKKRRKLSPDGQLIRTTNLPKNYKSYKYILSAFPNSFYEMKFDWEYYTFYDDNGKMRKPIEYEDYTKPVNITKKPFLSAGKKYNTQVILDTYLDNWVEVVKKNLEMRLNIDYRTVGTKWINNLAKTYYIYNFGDADDAEYNKKRIDEIKDYISEMKKNKVIIKTKVVSVEPSTLYSSGLYYLRAYIKFQVVSAKSISNQSKLIYGEHIYVKGLKKGKWKEMYIDIAVGSSAGSSIGEDYAVAWDSIISHDN